ncbi:response regulator transcription factor [Nocardia sp. NPDC051321]|uniref:response regulator transcription factor n=1 Tax=Nocardia sp. NPDC051321 TaxID=3364323 RepID=UPI00378BD9D4
MESNEAERRSLAERLMRHGYSVTAVDTAGSALECYHDADLVLLDVDLSDLDGIEVCRAIRDTSAVPIIILTARESVLDRVLGLRSGADDYITKPYGSRELIARIQAVLRRFIPDRCVTPVPAAAEPIRHGPLSIDVDARRVELAGDLVKTTRKEFDLLLLLASNPGKVIERSAITEEVWDGTLSSRTVDTHINSLRKKLGASEWIVTVRGIGFRFIGHRYGAQHA